MKIRNRLGNTTALALSLALSGGGAMAQNAAGGDVIQLGRIVIIGYTTDGTPVYGAENTSHLEGSAITAQGGTARIDEVLRQTPGVSTRLDVGQPGVAVAIRGLQGQGRVAMTIEGVPQSFRFNGHTSEGYAYVEQSFLSGIDVTRGAVVTTGGSGLAGSVNFRLLTAEELVEAEGSGGLIRLSYGENGEDFTRMVATAMVRGPVSLLGAYSAHTSSPFVDGNGVEVANSDRDTQSLLVRGEYRLSDTQTIEVLATRLEAEFAANSYYQELVSQTFKLGYHLEQSDLVDLRANLYRSNTESEYVGSLTGTGSYVGRVMETTTTGFNLTNVSRLSFGAWDLTSSNGFEIIRDALGGAEGGANPTFGEAERLALFTENVLINGPWEITAGLRYSSYSLHGELDNMIDSGPVDIDADSLDPKLTLAYQVNDWLQPYVSVYRTMRAPSLQETLQESFHGYGFFNLYLGPNPSLEPETSTGGEIGVNIDRADVFSAGDRLTARVAYFQMDVENYVASVEEDGFYPGVGPVTLAYYGNIPGTTVTSGLELEASYESDRFSAALSYTNSDTTPPTGSEGYQLQPPQTFSATLAGHFLNGALTAGATYSYTSAGVSLDTEADTEAYDLWDLFASYEVSENFMVTAKVSNVADEVYVPWASTGAGPGRNIYVGAEFRF